MAKKKSATVTKLRPAAPRQYPDLHDHLERLEREGLLIRVKEAVDKDQEMHPLVRWQFRGGIKEKDRKAFLFEKPVDAKGKSYDIPVAIGILAANRRIYGIGLGCDPTQVNQLWAEAKANPIPPVEIPSEAAPAHEVVYEGEELKVPGQGVDGIPVPISTPGWDNAPYISAAHFITRDPGNGIHNIGTYRAMAVDTNRQNLDLLFLLLRQQTFQLPELFYAEGSPITPVKNQNHCLLPAKVRQSDALALHVFKGEVGRGLPSFDSLRIRWAQIGTIFGTQLGQCRGIAKR